MYDVYYLFGQNFFLTILFASNYFFTKQREAKETKECNILATLVNSFKFK